MFDNSVQSFFVRFSPSSTLFSMRPHKFPIVWKHPGWNWKDKKKKSWAKQGDYVRKLSNKTKTWKGFQTWFPRRIELLNSDCSIAKFRQTLFGVCTSCDNISTIYNMIIINLSSIILEEDRKWLSEMQVCIQQPKLLLWKYPKIFDIFLQLSFIGIC